MRMNPCFKLNFYYGVNQVDELTSRCRGRTVNLNLFNVAHTEYLVPGTGVAAVRQLRAGAVQVTKEEHDFAAMIVEKERENLVLSEQRMGCRLLEAQAVATREMTQSLR
jgi:hypothetical protein